MRDITGRLAIARGASVGVFHQGTTTKDTHNIDACPICAEDVDAVECWVISWQRVEDLLSGRPTNLWDGREFVMRVLPCEHEIGPPHPGDAACYVTHTLNEPMHLTWERPLRV